MSNLESLLPELRDWNNGAGIDIESWIACIGNFQLAVGYSTVFWPRFVEFEGYVLREGFSVETLRGCEQCCSGVRGSVEALLNHLHIADIQTCGTDVTGEQIVYLGRTLREIYTAKLRWQFPDREFEVRFDEGNFENLIDYQLTFFQV